MGFLPENREPTRSEQLADQELLSNKSELEAKKQSLYRTRLDIIRGQGKQNWTPDKSSPLAKQPQSARFIAFPFGGDGFLR